MINRVFQLTAPRRIEPVSQEIVLQEGGLLVRPRYLAICAADQRYYMGQRKAEVLKKKLPMALIHEATGTVLYDPQEEIPAGTEVVMIPNTPSQNSDGEIKENYRTDSRFRSSNLDGFLQDVVQINRDRVIKLPSDDEVYVLCELLSVAFNAVKSMDSGAQNPKRIGIWGDGSVGFAVAVVLHFLHPEAELILFGKHPKKLQYFSFVQKRFLIDDIPDGIELDQCYECVGERGSGDALEQMLERIRPQGSIALMGVSEFPIPVNTRVILEKGLRLVGNSRSGKEDFQDAVELLETEKSARSYLRSIISRTVPVNGTESIHEAFDTDWMNDFKTVMKWEI